MYHCATHRYIHYIHLLGVEESRDGNQCVDFSRMVEQLTLTKSATLTVNT